MDPTLTKFVNSFPSPKDRLSIRETWAYTDLIDVDESYPIWKGTGIERESVTQLLEDIQKTRPAQDISNRPRVLLAVVKGPGGSAHRD